MKRYLKKKNRLLFLTEAGTWVHDISMARAFSSTAEASIVADHLRVRDMQIYLSFADSICPYDLSICLPLLRLPVQPLVHAKHACTAAF